jgi:hypothetical protein
LQIAQYIAACVKQRHETPFGTNVSTTWQQRMRNRSEETKCGLQLDCVVLLGRTFEEYRRYFLLEPDDLVGKKILDVAGGVSSFCAEGARHQRDFVRSDLFVVTRKNPGTFRAGPGIGLPVHWAGADISLGFLQKPHPEHYVAGELPGLPFADGEFDLALASYLLFAYQDRFDYEFHRDSVLEIMRVTRGKACIYPTVTFEAQPSEYIAMLRADPALRRFTFTEIKTDFEFIVNSNSFLKVTRA